MRARLFTVDGGTLGIVEIAEGKSAVDITKAVQFGRLFCVPLEEKAAEPAPASAPDPAAPRRKASTA